MARSKRTQAENDFDNLQTAVKAAKGLLPVLDRLLPEPSGLGPATGTIGRHAPESCEPWQAEAAFAYWNIYFGARHLADDMRRTAGIPTRRWASDDTDRALDTIAATAAAVPEEVLAVACMQVEGWVEQARRIRDIDEVDPWVPVPRVPGSQPPACPYCGTLSLRMRAAQQEVRCLFPGCVDYDGNPTAARMEPGLLDADGQLVFGDGTVVAYRGEQAYRGAQPATGGTDDQHPAEHRRPDPAD